MAELNTSILLNQVKPASPFEQFAALEQIKGLRDQSAMRQLQMDEAQDKRTRTQGLRAILGQGAQGPELVKALQTGGYMDEANAYQKQLNDQQTGQVDLAKKKLEIRNTLLSHVIADPREQTFAGAGREYTRLTGDELPDSFYASIYELRNDPEKIRQMAAGMALDGEKLLPKNETVDLGGIKSFIQRDPITGKVAEVSRAAEIDPNKPFNVSVDGAVTPNSPYQQYEISKAKAGAARNNNTVINAGPKAFETELGKLDAKQLDEYRATAEAAESTMSTIQNLRQAEKSGIFDGGGARAKTELANMLYGITGIEMKNLPGSQMFNAEASKLILDRIKSLGANPSNADREFIEKTVPMLATSATARQNMFNFMERKALGQIDRYQQADKYARKNSGLGGFKFVPAEPESPAPAGAGKPGGAKFLGFE